MSVCYFYAHHCEGVWDDLAIKILHDLAKIILSDFGIKCQSCPC